MIGLLLDERSGDDLELKTAGALAAAAQQALGVFA